MTPTDMFYNLLMNYCTEESVLILLDGDGVRALGGVEGIAPGNFAKIIFTVLLT